MDIRTKIQILKMDQKSYEQSHRYFYETGRGMADPVVSAIYHMKSEEYSELADLAKEKWEYLKLVMEGKS